MSEPLKMVFADGEKDLTVRIYEDGRVGFSVAMSGQEGSMEAVLGPEALDGINTYAQGRRAETKAG